MSYPSQRHLNETGDAVDVFDPIIFQDLWDFYTKANFLYAAKLEKLGPMRKEIADTWTKLLKADETICRLAIRKKNGKIKNSLCMLRYYHKTWIVHHMASIADPFGMMSVLMDSIEWMMKNEELDYGIFYWRPGNRTANRMFGSLDSSLAEIGIKVRDIQNYDYHFFNISKLALELDVQPSHVAVRMATSADYEYVSGLLRNSIGGMQYKAYSMDAANLDLGTTNTLFEQFGLFRNRVFFMAQLESEVVGIASVEISSKGLNFSFYLNKFEILFVDDKLQKSDQESVVYALIQSICGYLQKNDLEVTTAFCNIESNIRLKDFGFAVDREYRCLTISRSLESTTCLSHFKAFYNDRLKRHK